jgi:ATP-dependent DNA helicase RecG
MTIVDSRKEMAAHKMANLGKHSDSIGIRVKLKPLLSQIALGEDSIRQFKANIKNAESLASEMAAFANTNGGTIFIGVADDGSTPGLSVQDVARINQLISNAASHLVRSPLVVQTRNVALENSRIVIAALAPSAGGRGRNGTGQ